MLNGLSPDLGYVPGNNVSAEIEQVLPGKDHAPITITWKQHSDPTTTIPKPRFKRKLDEEQLEELQQRFSNLNYVQESDINILNKGLYSSIKEIQDKFLQYNISERK